MKINTFIKRSLRPLLLLCIVSFLSLGGVANGATATIKGGVKDASKDTYGVAKKLSILNFKVNAAEETRYVASAFGDMLLTRIGQGARVLPISKGAYLGARMGESADQEAAALAKGSDFVLYGVVSVLGTRVSVELRLVEVSTLKAFSITRSAGVLERVLPMAEAISSEVLKKVEDLAPVASSYRGKFSESFRPSDRVEEEALPDVVAVPGALGTRGMEPGVEAEPSVPSNTPGDTKPLAGSYLSAPLRSDNLDIEARSIAAADLNGDGQVELYLLRKDGLSIYTDQGGALTEVGRLEWGRDLTGVYVDVIKGYGKDNIVYVSRVGKHGTSGALVSYFGGEYRIIKDGLKWLVRSVRRSGGTADILGQEFSARWGFKGRVVRLTFIGEELVEKDALDLPRGINVFSFELFDSTGDGTPELWAYGRKGKLRVYKQAAEEKLRGRGVDWEIFTSIPGSFGGTLNRIRLGDPAATVDGHEAISDVKYASFEARSVYGDLDGDGTLELLTRSLTAGGIFGEWAEKISEYKSGMLKVIGYDGALFKEEWSSSEIGGFVADIFAFEVEDALISPSGKVGAGGKAARLYVLVVEGGAFTRHKKSYILSYEILL